MHFDITIEKSAMRKGLAFNGGSFAGIGFLIASLGATFSVSVRADVYNEARPIIDIKNGMQKAYLEFDGHDRTSGWNTWLTLSLSPAPPSNPRSAMLTKKRA
jgi:hypothetical protein